MCDPARLDRLAADHEQFRRDLEVHISETHALLVSKDRIDAADDDNRRVSGQILDTLLGPEIAYGLHAGTRDTTRGLEQRVVDLADAVDAVKDQVDGVKGQVADLARRAANGGVNARLAGRDRVVVYGGVAVLVARAVLGWLGVPV